MYQIQETSDYPVPDKAPLLQVIPQLAAFQSLRHLDLQLQDHNPKWYSCTVLGENLGRLVGLSQLTLNLSAQ